MSMQFRVLFREFLFQLVDLEWLARKGDLSKLLGQIASMLVFLSLIFSVLGLGLAGTRVRPPLSLFLALSGEHFMISTTMVIVGVFAVLSWDSTFPGRRDVFVLAPLPIAARTLLLAKVSAVGAGLGLTVALFHGLAGLVWPVTIQVLAPVHSGFLGVLRNFPAYWVTMFAAGTFTFCFILGLQGLAAQILPRRWFLKITSYLQLGAFIVLVGGYMIQPIGIDATVLSGARTWSPSIWFVGLLQQLNGSSSLPGLARRAWLGLAICTALTGVAYALSYFRTLRQIVEEPDIVPSVRGLRLLPGFGNPLATAIVQFSVRTLARSRRHRMILAFYWGIASALVLFFVKAPAVQQQLDGSSVMRHPNVAFIVADSLLLVAAILASRIVSSMPLELGANWVFQIAPVVDGRRRLSAIRRSIYMLGLVPAWSASAAVCLWLWPWRNAAAYSVMIVLIGITIAELCLANFHKIPFTCSYLPGRTYAHMALCGFGGLVFLVIKGARLALYAIADVTAFLVMVLILGAIAATAWWRAGKVAMSGLSELKFEEEPVPAILGLDLNRDGTSPVPEGDLKIAPAR